MINSGKQRSQCIRRLLSSQPLQTGLDTVSFVLNHDKGVSPRIESDQSRRFARFARLVKGLSQALKSALRRHMRFIKRQIGEDCRADHSGCVRLRLAECHARRLGCNGVSAHRHQCAGAGWRIACSLSRSDACIAGRNKNSQAHCRIPANNRRRHVGWLQAAFGSFIGPRKTAGIVMVLPA